MFSLCGNKIDTNCTVICLPIECTNWLGKGSKIKLIPSKYVKYNRNFCAISLLTNLTLSRKLPETTFNEFLP